MEIKKLLINESNSLKDALATIDSNGLGLVFVLNDASGKLSGVLTDGDIRRVMLKEYSLGTAIHEVMNRDFISLPVEEESNVILKHLSNKIKIIPLVDKDGKVVDYASIHKIKRIMIASPVLSGNELAYVTDCITTNWISSQGKYVRQFEELFTEYHLGHPSIAVSNGTVALHLALEALQIKKGDEVIVPDLTFAASVNAILYTGATPVLADIDKHTWNMDVSRIESLITPRTRAIMPVHLYGQPCDMQAIMAIAKKHNLLVIEDCAEALGSSIDGKPVGTFGDASTFSFYGNKTITTGEGGMVVFKDKQVADRALMLRDHGMKKDRRYWHEEVGYNYRLTNIQAAIGVAQFEQMSDFVVAKIHTAKTYTQALEGLGHFQLPVTLPNTVNSYWLYTILINPDAPFTRDELMEHLSHQGIETRPVFYTMHEMPPYQSYGQPSALANSMYVSRQGMSLPSSANLSPEELQHVCAAIKHFSESFVREHAK